MKLVETDAEGPSGDEPIVTPPRPEKRRVSISLLFTVSVLVATVVTIYSVFPARDNELLAAALRLQRQPPPWDLAAPSDAEVRAWAIAAVGRGAPLPSGLPLRGVATISVLGRPAALLRYQVGEREVSYLIQHARSLGPRAAERVDAELRAAQWREGPWLVVSAGPADDPSWLAATQRR
jgi:hypothetical protein